MLAAVFVRWNSGSPSVARTLHYATFHYVSFVESLGFCCRKPILRTKWMQYAILDPVYILKNEEKKKVNVFRIKKQSANISAKFNWHRKAYIYFALAIISQFQKLCRKSFERSIKVQFLKVHSRWKDEETCDRKDTYATYIVKIYSMKKWCCKRVGQSFRIVTRRNNNSNPAYRHCYYYLSPSREATRPNAINRALQPITVP